jgi:acetyltransferase-like isoleucine patch superfamily enzyme
MGKRNLQIEFLLMVNIDKPMKSLPFLFLKLLSSIEASISSIHYRKKSNIHKQAKLLPGSKILNILGIKDAIEIGENTLVIGEILTFGHGGKIQIGKHCYIGENSRIWSAEKIKIGDRVLISHNVNIHDNDGHPIDPHQRHEQFLAIASGGHPRQDIGIKSSPIEIEDDVWLCFNSTILKGVTIGKGSIVGASSVVTKDVPPGTIVAGNPARIIRKIS